MTEKKTASSKKAVKKATGAAKTQKPKKWQFWKTAGATILMLAWVLVAIYLAQIIIGYPMIWILGADTFQEPVWVTAYSALYYSLALALVVLVPPNVSVAWKIVNEKKHGKKLINGKVAPRATGREELGLRGWPTWTDIGLSLAGVVTYLVLAAAVTALFTIFPWFQEVADQTQDVGFSLGLSGIDRVVAFVTLVVVAPIAEEIIFRGWLYGKLRSKFLHKMPDWAGMTLAILLTSVLFGAVHGQWNVAVNVFALSVVACGLREITGTVYAGILLHMIKNGLAFYLLYVIGVA